MTVRRAEGRRDALPLNPGVLPIELYIKVGIADPGRARQWCGEVIDLLDSADLSQIASGLERIVVWGPPPPEPGMILLGGGFAYVSELAMRIIRARSTNMWIPPGPVILIGELERGLKMYRGSQADQRAYDAVHSR